MVSLLHDILIHALLLWNNLYNVKFYTLDDSALISSVKVAEMNQVFQCGSKSIQLRNPQGSALLTFNSHNGNELFINF